MTVRWPGEPMHIAARRFRLVHPEHKWLSRCWEIGEVNALEYQNGAGTFVAEWLEGDPECRAPGAWVPPRGDTWGGADRLLDEEGRDGDGDHWTLAVNIDTGSVWIGVLYAEHEGWEFYADHLHGECVRLTARNRLERYDNKSRIEQGRGCEQPDEIRCIYERDAGEDLPL